MSAANARARTTALRLSAAAALLSAAGAVGHILDLPTLLTFVPGRPPIQPLTALLITLTALGMALRHGSNVGRARRMSAQIVGALVLLLACMVGSEYLLGLNFGPRFGRPSPFTAVAFAALGGALVVFDLELRALVPREGLCLVAIFVAFVCLVGHAFGAGALYQLGRSKVIGVALPTCLALILLGSAGLLERPDVGLSRLLTSSGPGGVLLRRLGLTAVVAGPLLGIVLHALAGVFRSTRRWCSRWSTSCSSAWDWDFWQPPRFRWNAATEPS
jgi:hypothetical protein